LECNSERVGTNVDKRYLCHPSFSCVSLDRFERKSVSMLRILELDTLPVRSDRTVDCSCPGADCKLVTLVAIIFRVLHKVMVTGSLIVPGADIGQSHLGSLKGKYTITAWNLAPRHKSVKEVAIVTVPPYPHPF
jgi:hypothetical protein